MRQEVPDHLAGMKGMDRKILPARGALPEQAFPCWQHLGQPPYGLEVEIVVAHIRGSARSGVA